METGLLLAKAKETTNSSVYFHFRSGETEAWGGLPSTGGSGQLFCHLVSHPNSEVMPTSASSLLNGFLATFSCGRFQNLFKKRLPRMGGTFVTAVSDCDRGGWAVRTEGSKKGCAVGS